MPTMWWNTSYMWQELRTINKINVINRFDFPIGIYAKYSFQEIKCLNLANNIGSQSTMFHTCKFVEIRQYFVICKSLLLISPCKKWTKTQGIVRYSFIQLNFTPEGCFLLEYWHEYGTESSSSQFEYIVTAQLNFNSSWEWQSNWLAHQPTPPIHHQPPQKLLRHFH